MAFVASFRSIRFMGDSFAKGVYLDARSNRPNSSGTHNRDRRMHGRQLTMIRSRLCQGGDSNP